MGEFTREELEEARLALASTLHKCEAAQQSLLQKMPSQRSPQLTLLKRRLRALQIALALIAKELGEAGR